MFLPNDLPIMKGNSSKGNPFIVAISQKLRNIGSGRLSAIRGKINTNRTLDKVEKRLARWVKEGRHHECDNSMEEILDELGLTNGELSFYCSHVLNKKFLTWRKEMRIEDAKKLLMEQPETPVRHIGYIIGFSDKSNFRRQFREVVGCTPTEWRRKNLKEYDHSNE